MRYTIMTHNQVVFLKTDSLKVAEMMSDFGWLVYDEQLRYNSFNN